MNASNMNEIRDFFAKDRFATECLGATVDDYDPETSTATVSMTLEERHNNAQGFVMGGVFFALADFALAVSSNTNKDACSSVNSSIAFMRRAKGSKLKAVARPEKLGRNLSFFIVDIYDELGTHVSQVTTTAMVTNH